MAIMLAIDEGKIRGINDDEALQPRLGPWNYTARQTAGPPARSRLPSLPQSAWRPRETSMTKSIVKTATIWLPDLAQGVMDSRVVVGGQVHRSV